MAKGYNQFMQGLVGKVGAIVVTTNGEQTIMRKRVYVNKSDTPAQQQQKANITGLAHLWSTLTPGQMDAWHTLGQQMPDKAGTRMLTNYQAFVSVNGLLLACGKPTVVNAPAAPTPPASLPPLMLVAGLAGDNFVLSIQSAAYTGLVQVFAAAAASPGRNSFSRAAYKQIGTLSALTSGTTSIAALFQARFGTPTLGRRIAVRLVPVSATGFAGAEILPTSVVSDPSAAANAPRVADQSLRQAA